VSNSAGQSNIEVIDSSNSANSASLAVSVTSPTNAAANLTLQASPAVVSKGSSGISTLIATVTDSNGLPVGNAPVVFSIPAPTGGGESVSPVVAYTASEASSNLALGQAMATFTAGSLSSGAQGVQVDALVPATAASGVAAVVIGGTAASVAFGQATSASTTSDGTSYILNMSVLVADSNGNPAPAGTRVNIGAWPIAWSTGSSCAYDADGVGKGTFDNEDITESLILGTTFVNGLGLVSEDGLRIYYYNTFLPSTNGSKTGQLVPPSSAAGVVQSANASDLLLGSSVVTTVNGLASFTLTYPKTSAIYIVDRIRATTTVQGTESVGEMIFRLPATKTDVGPPCILPSSIFTY
jgi:hypothetical protein